ncbi:MAG TPA: SDR family oxidoreductase [Acidimicrobiales bacterium]|nr:SDR family oxidoreductase [Acidimicrobiales bacterium]
MIDIPQLFSLQDQVAVITGAASGIGAATAEVLASAGAAVVLGDIDIEGVQGTAEKLNADGGRAVAQKTNTAVRTDVDALVERAMSEHGRLDIMANVAGIGHLMPVSDITEEEFDRVMGVNLKGVLFGSQAALKVMLPRRSGSIVNVASTVIDSPYPGQGLYGMTKAAVTFMSQVLAAEAGPQGIRVNVLAPGSTPTNFASFRYEGGKVDPEKEALVQKAMSDMTPLGFLGDAYDQARMVLFLVSPAARWVTGNIWRVNGGQSRPW